MDGDFVVEGLKLRTWKMLLLALLGMGFGGIQQSCGETNAVVASMDIWFRSHRGTALSPNGYFLRIGFKHNYFMVNSPIYPGGKIFHVIQ